MNQTIRIDAARYQDHDDCLAAAASDYSAAHDLQGWDLDPRWEDEQRDTIILTVPGLKQEHSAMTRYAIIESNTGYVWGVVDAESALAACTAVDQEIGDRPGEGRYEAASLADLRSNLGVYDVREAPAGFDVSDGQDPASIAAVQAMPRAGVFAWARADGAW